MSDATLAPVAVSPDGTWVACGDGPELLAFRGDGQPAWKAFGEGVVIAVGITQRSVVVADSDGRVTWYRLVDGRVEETSRGSPPVAAAVDPSGMVAAAPRDGGLEVAVPGRTHQSLGGPAASAVAFGPAGQSLGTGAPDGMVSAVDPSSGAAWGHTQLGSPVRGVAWSALNQWVVTTDRALIGVSGDGSEVQFRIPCDVVDAPLGAVAVSDDGLLVAALLGAHQVAVFELHEHRYLGTVDFRRPLGGVCFGSGSVLVIALDDGDLSFIDLAAGTTWRSEPHRGRGRNTWNLDMRVDLGGIRGARVKSQAGGAAIAAYTGWRPEDEEGGGGGWLAGCMSCLTGCGCLTGALLAGMLAMYLMRSYGLF